VAVVGLIGLLQNESPRVVSVLTCVFR